MKRQVLFMALVLTGLTSATAKTTGDVVSIGEDLNNTRYSYAQPILFVERGVEFLVFSDGSFDFNTDIFSTVPNDNGYYHRRSPRDRRSNARSRRGINRTNGAPGTTYRNRNRGVLITQDREGRVRRIGNVFINYDRQGRLKRVGSVYMTYRRGQLKQVGGLTLLYNRHRNIIGTRGFVNRSNQGCGLCGTSSCTIDHFYNHMNTNDRNNNWDDDDAHYYYKKNGKIKKQKKRKKNKN